MKKNIHEPPAERIVSIGEKLAFLQGTAAYPFQVERVETKETHMSWVFLANGFVYKLKKPVAYHYLDFRELESRYRNCREEVQLNRRLAPDIYLGIVSLTIDEKGNLALSGKGTIVDWLVQMKRIPEQNMLDHAIRHHTVSEASLQQVAALLAKFYKNAPAVLTDASQYREKLKGEIQSIYNELVNPVYHLPANLVDRLITGLQHFLTTNYTLFDERVNKGKIIEAHGDLRPEHICPGPEPAIIDCLEFKRDLRILDTAEELSFLAMECEITGNDPAGMIFFDTYTSVTLDHIPGSLVNFYKTKRACLRAFLVVRHIIEEKYKNDPKWLSKANGYLQLAERHCKLLPA